MLHSLAKPSRTGVLSAFPILVLSAIACGFAPSFLPGKYFIAVILLAILFFLVLEYPESSIYIIVFFFPFIGWPRVFGGVHTGVPALFLFGLLAIALFLANQLYRGRLQIPKFPILPYHLIFLSSVVISSIASADIPIAATRLHLAAGRQAPDTVLLTNLVRYFYFLFIMFPIIYFINDKKRFTRCFDTLIFSSAVFVLYGLYTYFGTVLGFTHYRLFAGLGLPRMTSAALEPQQCGYFLAIALVFTMAKFLSSEGARPWIIVLLALQLLALFLTFSAGAFFALFSSAIVFAVLGRNYFVKRRKRELLILCAVVFVALMVLAFYLGIDKLWDMFLMMLDKYGNPSNYSNFLRRSVRATAWNMFLEHPLWGVGPGKFAYFYSYYRPDWARIYTQLTPCHNQYLALLSEQGIFGFLSYILIIWCVVKNLFTSFIKVEGRRSKLVVLSFLSAFCGILAGYWAIMESYFPYFWFFVALSQVCVLLSRDNRPEAGPVADLGIS